MHNTRTLPILGVPVLGMIGACIRDGVVTRRQIGERLKGLRVAAGLSQPQLAIAAAIQLRRFQRLEMGERTITLIEATNLSRQLNCEINQLISFES